MTISVFTANDGVYGEELWATDGTASGTVLLDDITPGAAGTTFSGFTRIGGLVYFAARNAAGIQLWQTDGTSAGTVPLTAVATDTSPRTLLATGNRLFYVGGSASTGTSDFFVTDGTPGGTTTLSIRDGSTYGGGFESAVAVAGHLFFLSYTVMYHYVSEQLWVSDGTQAGTALFDPPVTITALSLTALGTKIVFSGRGAGGTELWVTDGTVAGTSLLKDIYPGSGSSNPSNLTRVGALIFFTADDGIHGTELWATDGTTAGTRLVSDVAPGNTPSSPANLTAFGAKLLFTATGATAATTGLYLSDGTSAGTIFLHQVTLASAIVAAGTNVFFTGTDGTHAAVGLYVSDGTASGTRYLAPVTVSGALVASGNDVFFSATTAAAGTELWVSDGTVAGTHLVQDINPGAVSSSPTGLHAVPGGVVFAATNPSTGTELYRSDGTAAGTVLVKDIRMSSDQTASLTLSQSVTRVGALNIFAADDGTTGDEPWVSDGTAAGTHLLTDINAGDNDSDPSDFVALGSKVVFVATDAAHGQEVWVTDGTAAGTTLLKDVVPGATGSAPTDLIAFGGRVYFDTDDPTNGYRLWSTDGTTAGTTPLLTFQSFGSPVVLGSHLLVNGQTTSDLTSRGLYSFTAGSATPTLLTQTNADEFLVGTTLAFVTSGYFVGSTDGTPAGTNLNIGGDPKTSYVLDAVLGGQLVYSSERINEEDVLIWNGGSGNGTLLATFYTDSVQNAQDFTVVGSQVFFESGRTSSDNLELWVSDGTAAGTVLVRDINPGDASSDPTDLTAFNGRLYFAATDGTIGGSHVWTSDGTLAGTTQITVGNDGSDPLDLEVVGSSLLFLATNAGGVLTLYGTDGTAAGTTVLRTFAGKTGPANVSVSGGKLYFTLTDPAVGTELWTSDATAAGTMRLTTTASAGSSDPAQFTTAAAPTAVTVPAFLANQPALDAQNGGFAIADTAANVKAALASLAADNDIVAITATSGTVTVSVAKFLVDRNTLDLIAGGFAVTDTASAIAAAAAALDSDRHIAAITYLDGSGAVLGAITYDQGHTTATIGGGGILVDLSGVAVTMAGTAVATINGGGNTITGSGAYTLTAVGTNVVPDLVNGSGATLVVGVNAQVYVTGTGNTITLGTGDSLAVTGGGNIIGAGAGDLEYLTATNGTPDVVHAVGDQGTTAVNQTAGISMAANVQANLTCDNTLVSLVTGDSVAVAGGGNTIVAGAGDLLYLTATGGNDDLVKASGVTGTTAIGQTAAIVVGDDAQADITGGQDLVVLGSRADASVNGSDQIVAGAGDSVTIEGTNGVADAVQANGVQGTSATGLPAGIILDDATQANVTGSDNQITLFYSDSLSIVGGNNTIQAGPFDLAFLSGTKGAADTVAANYARGTTALGEAAGILLADNTQANVTGGNNLVVLGAGDSLALSGSNNVLYAGAGDLLFLGGTGGTGDTVTASGVQGTTALGQTAAILLDNDTQANVTGSSDLIVLGTGDSLAVTGAGNTIDAGANDLEYLTGTNGIADTVNAVGDQGSTAVGQGAGILLDNNTQANIVGSGNLILLGTGDSAAVQGAGNTISAGANDLDYLFGTNGLADAITASNDQGTTAAGQAAGLVLADNAQANVTGGNNAITLGTGDSLAVAGGGNTIQAGSGDLLYLTATSGAGDQVFANNDQGTTAVGQTAGIVLGDNVLSNVTGANNAVALGAASTLGLSGNGNTIAAGANDAIYVTGQNETTRFGAPAFGNVAFSGYAAGDVFSFAPSVFANYAALSAHVSGTSNAVITDAGGDTLTLNGVAPSSLTPAMFKFA